MMPRFVSFMLFLATSCCVWGCPQGEPCSEADANKLEIQYQAELGAKCVAFGPNCPDKAAIDEKYRNLREGWVACHGK